MQEFHWGDRVRFKKTGEEGIVDRIGINSGVYSIVPPLGGQYWHIAEELEPVMVMTHVGGDGD